MSGDKEPVEITEQCTAECYIADKYGDNEAAMRCQLLSGHSGSHREVFRDGKCVLTWEVDERPERIRREIEVLLNDLFDALIFLFGGDDTYHRTVDGAIYTLRLLVHLEDDSK